MAASLLNDEHESSLLNKQVFMKKTTAGTFFLAKL